MPSISIQPNRAYQNIPDVSDDLASQKVALQTIKDALQTHERRDNNYLQSFIRFEELVELGIINEIGEFVLEVGGSGTTAALDDLTDVTIVPLVNDNILGYDTGSAMWTSQSAGDLGLSVVGHTHPIPPIELDDLTDVDLTGAQDNDLLFRSGGQWLPTMGNLQWDGADIRIPAGDILFYGPLDAVSQSIQQDSPAIGDLTIDAPFGDLYLADGTSLIMSNADPIRWQDTGGVAVEHLNFRSASSPSIPITDEWTDQDLTSHETESSTYVDVPGFFVDVSTLKDTAKYFFYNESGHGNSIINGSPGDFIRMTEDAGATTMAGSEGRVAETTASGFPWHYSFERTVDTADDDFALQFRLASGTFDTRVRDWHSFGIDVSDLPADSYLYFEDTGTTNYTTSYTDTGATVTVTEPGDWLFFVNAYFDDHGAIDPLFIGLNDGSSVTFLTEYTPENSSEVNCMGGMYVVENVASPTTFTVAIRAGATAGTSSRAMICAIRLDAFVEHYVDKDETDQVFPLAGAPYLVRNFTAVNTGTFMAIGYVQQRWPAAGGSGRQEITVDINAGGPTTVGHNSIRDAETNLIEYMSPILPSTTFSLTAGDSVEVVLDILTASPVPATEVWSNQGLIVFALETAPVATETFFAGDPAFITQIDGLAVNVTADLDVAGDITVSGLVDGRDVLLDGATQDSHIADATLHFTEASIDHTNILNIGTNTHAQIDTHIADTDIHFTDAPADGTPYGREDNAWVPTSSGGMVTGISLNSGADVNAAARSTLNFIEGANITLTIADDGAGDEVDITIATTAGALSNLQFQMAFDDSTAAGDPGAGQVRLNSVGVPTAIHMDDLDDAGNDLDWILSNLSQGDILAYRSTVDDADYGVFKVNDVTTDNAGFWSIEVIQLFAGSLPTDGDLLDWEVQWNATSDASISNINIQNGDYTLIDLDNGKTISKESGGAGETITIPAMGTAQLPVGAVVYVNNDGGGDLSIAITTDTLAGTDGATGTRTLGTGHVAKLHKVGTTNWKYSASDL